MLRVTDHVERSDTGRARKANEDSFHARSPLFVVADGMGGAQAGEVASRMAVERFAAGLPDGSGTVEARLASLVEEANHAIHEHSRADSEQAGMGTTVTAAYVATDGVAIAHVGDSRAYRLRDGVLERLTDDHSLVEEMLRQGKLTPQEAAEHPQRSIITRALGPEPGVQVDTRTAPARDGDVFLLCSDGLTSMVAEDVVEGILTRARSLRDAAADLVAAANDAGGRDNITVVLFAVEDVGGEAPEPPPTRAHAAPAPGDGVRTATSAGTATATVARRPRARTAPAPTPARRRRGVPGWLKGALVATVILVPVLVGLWAATQSVYFIGTDAEGRVTLFRGVPYALPVGVDLYSANFVSGVSAAAIPAARRDRLLDHKWRSHDDAVDLVRRLERGELRTTG